ncbi:putative aarF domain-containing protein kinase [Apostasia shenzhenica]|uniref:Putative aarF domain-containing protein kinase n=1 Tax=Apostasia shenzhenica TaxID=1088818 RepID=A0A2I0AD04_9ASPA|nr:putative aarF domain-containing protein kinase [Apostasia shenzhenica]
MADLEALKIYADYVQSVFEVWTTPLPEFYDPEKVEQYFSCRPHVLLLRMIEVLASFSYAVIRVQFARAFKFIWQGAYENYSLRDSQYHVGQILKEAMLHLGPTFVKVGQSLSTRPDIIGSETSEALSGLHDKIPAFPRAVAMKIIEKELGGPVNYFFKYISEEPVAAASFGQVYQGCTLDGCIVAIKVQRPDLLHSVVRDIYILRLGLNILRIVAKRKNDLSLYADELGKGLVGELDYRIEAANASEFLEAHSRYSFMLVPRVHRHLSTKKVLTMEWMVGENPNHLLLQSRGLSHGENKHTKVLQLEAKRCLLDLVNKGVEATLVQLLESGLLHADPHPGNLFYTKDGRIGFMDFGLLCRMKKEHQTAMLASIIHIVNGDWGALVYDLTLMDVVRPNTNLYHVRKDLVETLGVVDYSNGIPAFKFSLVLGKIWSIALKYHFRMPPYFTLVLRSLASWEGLAVAADQNFKTFEAAYPYVVMKLLHDNSATTRRILYSVVFNKRMEIQWKKVQLFLKIGSVRYVDEKSQRNKQDAFEVVHLILRLLLSKDGAVLRRLLMAADTVSLTEAMISKDAWLFRRYIGLALADAIYRRAILTENGSQVYEMEGKQTRNIGSTSPASTHLHSIMQDRRLRVIFYRKFKEVSRHPLLMLRASWSCFTVFVMALAITLNRFVANFFDAFFNSIKFVPGRIAVSFSQSNSS